MRRNASSCHHQIKQAAPSVLMSSPRPLLHPKAPLPTKLSPLSGAGSHPLCPLRGHGSSKFPFALLNEGFPFSTSSSQSTEKAVTSALRLHLTPPPSPPPRPVTPTLWSKTAHSHSFESTLISQARPQHAIEIAPPKVTRDWPSCRHVERPSLSPLLG